MRSRTVMVLCGEIAVLAVLLGVALDQVAHTRVQSMAGVNRWGYRGAVMRARGDREIRLAVAGGDRAFGWGVAPEEATPAYLRTLVQVSLPAALAGYEVTAANIAALGLPARGYAARIDQYRYLRPDVVCLYVDLVDRTPASIMPPSDSRIAALTGYVPMLPLALEEKGAVLSLQGRRLAGVAATAVGRALRFADRSIPGGSSAAAQEFSARRSVVLEQALDAALRSAPRVAVIVPMPFDADERAAHAVAMALFHARAASDLRIRVVDLSLEPRLAAADLRLNAASFGAGGHWLSAEAIAPVVTRLLAEGPVHQ